jgi:hypothetical protein
MLFKNIVYLEVILHFRQWKRWKLGVKSTQLVFLQNPLFAILGTSNRPQFTSSFCCQVNDDQKYANATNALRRPIFYTKQV